MPTTPTIIGIAGGSGSGKTTLAENVLTTFADQSITLITHDSYYLPQDSISFKQRLDNNYDHPRALDNQLLIDHLLSLKSGKSVQIPRYDFKQHTRTSQTTELSPSKVILVEGILLFAHQQLRDQLNIKIFVDTPSDIRIVRRIQRDRAERGRSIEEIIDRYYRDVRPMHLKYVEPSKQFADIVIPEGGENQVALEVLQAYVEKIINRV